MFLEQEDDAEEETLRYQQHICYHSKSKAANVVEVVVSTDALSGTAEQASDVVDEIINHCCCLFLLRKHLTPDDDP